MMTATIGRMTSSPAETSLLAAVAASQIFGVPSFLCCIADSTADEAGIGAVAVAGRKLVAFADKRGAGVGMVRPWRMVLWGL